MTSLFILFELATGRIRMTLPALESDIGVAGGVLETAVSTGASEGLELVYAKLPQNEVPDSRTKYVVNYVPSYHINGSGGEVTVSSRPEPFFVPTAGAAPVTVPLAGAPSGTNTTVVNEEGEIISGLDNSDDLLLVDPGHYWIRVVQTPWPYQTFCREVIVT